MNIDHQESLEAEVKRLRERVTELEAALRQYADARHWGLQRFDHTHPAAVWIGPGAVDLPIPDAPAIARAALAGDGGGSPWAEPPDVPDDPEPTVAGDGGGA